MLSLRQSNFDSEVMESGLPVLVDFYSDSCIPCKRLSPVLAELEEIYHDRFRLAKVNINFEPELTETYGIVSLPTLLFFLGGRERKRIEGPVNKDGLIQSIHEILEGI